jgi:hypothetical protein
MGKGNDSDSTFPYTDSKRRMGSFMEEQVGVVMAVVMFAAVVVANKNGVRRSNDRDMEFTSNNEDK